MSAVDEFDLDEGYDDGGAAPARSPRRRAAQPWAWFLAAAALVGLGAANAEPLPVAFGLGNGIELRLLDLDIRHEPVTVWSTDLRFPEVMLTERDRAVVVTDDTGTGRSVLGIDLGTGAEVWHYQDEGYTCTWSGRVGCIEHAGTPQARLVLIDLADGTRTTQDHPQAVAVIAVGDEHVVIEATDTRQEDVVLVEADGSERWRVDLDAVDTESFPYWRQLEVLDDRLMLYVAGVSVDLTTGAVAPTARWRLYDNVTIELAADARHYTVYTADRSVTLGVDELLLPYDDDLGGPVVVVQDHVGGIIASWRDDDTELWRTSATEAACQPMARLRTTLVVQCWDATNERLTALDLLTGQEQWRRPPMSFPAGATSTSLLLIDFQQGELLAVDVATGAQHWALPLSTADSTSLTEISDGVLLTTGDSLVRLQWQ